MSHAGKRVFLIEHPHQLCAAWGGPLASTLEADGQIKK